MSKPIPRNKLQLGGGRISNKLKSKSKSKNRTKKTSIKKTSNKRKTSGKYSHVKSGQTVTFKNGSCAKRLSNGRFRFVKKNSCKKNTRTKKLKGGGPTMKIIGGEEQLVYKSGEDGPTDGLMHYVDYGLDNNGNDQIYYMTWHPTTGWYDGNAQVMDFGFDEYGGEDEDDFGGRYSPDNVLDTDSR